MLPRPDRSLIVRSLGLVAGGALVGLGLNAARPGGVALTSFQPDVACSGTSHHEPAIDEMDPRAASALCGRPGVVFADTRTAARYAEGHVADALHLPCDGAAADSLFRKLSAAETVVVYGDSSDDTHA